MFFSGLEMRLVLLGTTGDGKSSAGNTILGGEFFKVASGAKSLTERSEAKQNVIGQRKVKVVDTPGFLNENLSDLQLVSELQKSITECSPGPHAFVIILSVETFTDQEGEIVEEIRKVFGNAVFKHAVILFTYGDELREDQTIQKFVGQNKELKDLVDECGGRCHVVDNKHWNQPQDQYRNNRVQVENLLKTVEGMMRQNGGRCISMGILKSTGNDNQMLNDLRLVLLGTTGDGKSSAGNTILGGEFFKVASGAKSLTERSEAKQNVIGQRKVKVVDTPGFLNENLSDQQLVSELQKSITECSPGPHAFVIILSVETFTDQEGEIVEEIRKVFGNAIFKHAVILFTYGDELREDQTIQKFVGQNNELKDLVDECGGRCHVVDNKHWNQPQDQYRNNRVQVEKLLKTVDGMMEQNGGRVITMEMLKSKGNDNQMFNDLRLVLLGTTGDGKSSAGNTILGGEFFKVASGAKSLTERSEAKQNVIGQRKVKVVDTPGFLNENLSDQQIMSELQKSITECSPGPHAFVIILSVETFTDQEGEIVEEIRKVFGNAIFKHAVILFTSGDELREDQTIQQFVGQNKELKDLVDECGGRCHVVDNKHWNQPQDQYRNNKDQVEKMLKTIEGMMRQNGGRCMTMEMLKSLGKENQKPNDLRLVLLGTTGDGKSSAGNTILGGEFFKVASGAKSLTERSEAKQNVIGQRKVKVVDTPGFLNENLSDQQLVSELQKSITECSPGPHAFVIILSVETFTDQEGETLDGMRKVFGNPIFKYGVILFTSGDELREDQTIEQFVGQNKELKDLVGECGGRCHVVDNKHWNQPQDRYRSNRVQVEKLLKTIDGMMEHNGGGCFTAEMLPSVKREKPVKKEVEVRERSKVDIQPLKTKEKYSGQVVQKKEKKTCLLQ
ncbi:GTPase IMAP family member 8-like isoform X2 [Denticeps clupeoides]|uniref:GTPase IMAP family member 8-like isoform X2 n=1 Tax=Denticeps clupeoides TaxID=299321 RepID=UPI0010A4AEC5|nr:GTPase IMAP family member 8-like isoform X2 [Denticeps clupeoides]